MVNSVMYEYRYNMVVFTMFFGQIMPIMSSYDSESELELSTWIDAFFDFFFIDSRKSFTNTLGGTMSSEGKAISKLLCQWEGKDQGRGTSKMMRTKTNVKLWQLSKTKIWTSLKGIICWPKCFYPLPLDLLSPIYKIKPHLYCILIAGENPHQFMLQNIDNVKDF